MGSPRDEEAARLKNALKETEEHLAIALASAVKPLEEKIGTLWGEIEEIKQNLIRLGKAQSRMSTTLDAQNELWEESLKEISSAQAKYRDAVNEARESLRAQAQNEALAAALKEILPFLDNLREALRLMADVSKTEPALADWVDGLERIVDQGDLALGALGITRIETVGHKFDPHLHRALEVVPVQDASLANVVVSEIRPGYIYNGKVIRYADVGVGKLERSAVEREPYYRDRPWDDQFSCGDAGRKEAEGNIGGWGQAHTFGGGDLSGREASGRNSSSQPVYSLS